MTNTLRDKLVAASHTEVFHGKGAQKSIALQKALALLDEHCAGQGEMCEDYIQRIGYDSREAWLVQKGWNAAIATITGRE